MELAKPPLKRLAFDISVRNRSGHPRWFIFPAALYEHPAASVKNSGIDGLEVSASPAGHAIRIAHFMGTFRIQPDGAGGFKALLLPGHGGISVRGFSISYWGDDPRPDLALKVIVADDVLLGGVPVTRWTGNAIEFMNARRATGHEKNLAVSASFFTKDRSEQAVEFKNPEEITISRVLAAKCGMPPAK